MIQGTLITKIEAAIEKKTIVEFSWGIWGILTALSDDKSTVYYKKNGCGLFRYATALNHVVLLGGN